MPVTNRHMSRDAKKNVWTHTVRPLNVGFEAGALIDQECDLRILRIDSVFAAPAGAAEDETILIGTSASTSLYLSYVVPDTQAAGVKTAHTLASAALLPAGTALIIRKTAVGADAGATAEISFNVTYERLDKSNVV